MAVTDIAETVPFYLKRNVDFTKQMLDLIRMKVQIKWLSLNDGLAVNKINE